MASFFTRRSIIVILVLLALSIPLGIKLVQQQTRLKSKAVGTEIKFKGSNVTPNPCDPANQTCSATQNSIDLEVNTPFGFP